MVTRQHCVHPGHTSLRHSVVRAYMWSPRYNFDDPVLSVFCTSSNTRSAVPLHMLARLALLTALQSYQED
jgi:hypothetical protein